MDLERDVIQRLDDHAFVYGSINFTNPTSGWVLGVGASDEMGLTDSYNKINEAIRGGAEGRDEIEFSESVSSVLHIVVARVGFIQHS